MAFDPYQVITDRIIAQIESGSPKWRMPWKNGLNMNHASGNVYRPLNQMLLASAGFEDNRWLTPNQCREMGVGFKGAKQIQIPTYFETKGKSKDSREGESAPLGDDTAAGGNTYWRLWLQPLFNAEQLQGMPPLEIEEQALPFSPIEIIDAMADAVCERTGLKIQHGGTQAYYSPSLHTIKLPRKELFLSTLDYYMTLLHELGHSTMDKSMLGRDVNYIGAGRAKEELIAEFSATYLGAKLRASPSETSLENHAAYIKSWLEYLRNDKKAVFNATKEAERICEHLATFAPDNVLGAPSKASQSPPRALAETPPAASSVAASPVASPSAQLQHAPKPAPEAVKPAARRKFKTQPAPSMPRPNL